MIPPDTAAYSEINVACESCHGPGRKHVEMARANQGWEGLTHFGLTDVNAAMSHRSNPVRNVAYPSVCTPERHANDSFSIISSRGGSTMVSDAGTHIPCGWAD